MDSLQHYNHYSHGISRLRTYQWLAPLVTGSTALGLFIGRQLVPLKHSNLRLAFDCLALTSIVLSLAAPIVCQFKIKKLVYQPTITFDELAQRLKPIYGAYFSFLSEQMLKLKHEFRHDNAMEQFLKQSAPKDWAIPEQEWLDTAKEFLNLRVHHFVSNQSEEILDRCLKASPPGSPHLVGFSDFSQKGNHAQGSTIAVLGDIQGSVGGLINFLARLKVHPDFTLPEKAPHIVLIGDLVDGSVFGYEVWYIAMRLYIANPGKVTILKGNHELYDISNHAEYGMKYGDSNQPRTWRKLNESTINLVGSTLPSVYVAESSGMLCCFSHSIDPKARPDLLAETVLSAIPYSDASDVLKSSLSVQEPAEGTLALPAENFPGREFGMNKCLVYFFGKTQPQFDLTPAFGLGCMFLSERVVEIWKTLLKGGHTVQHWTIGHHDAPTHGVNQGIATGEIGGGAQLNILDYSCDDLKTTYAMPYLKFTATNSGWQANTKRIEDKYDYYTSKPIPPIN